MASRQICMLTLTNLIGLLGSDWSDSQNGEPPHLSAAKKTLFDCKDNVQCLRGWPYNTLYQYSIYITWQPTSLCSWCVPLCSLPSRVRGFHPTELVLLPEDPEVTGSFPLAEPGTGIRVASWQVLASNTVASEVCIVIYRANKCCFSLGRVEFDIGLGALTTLLQVTKVRNRQGSEKW